jgi:hypothetical protein
MKLKTRYCLRIAPKAESEFIFTIRATIDHGEAEPVKPAPSTKKPIFFKAFEEGQPQLGHPAAVSPPDPDEGCSFLLSKSCRMPAILPQFSDENDPP